MKKPSFGTLGTLIVRRRRATLILFLIATLLFGGIGSAVFGKLKDGGYSDPKSDSYRAYDYLVNTLNVKEPTITFVFPLPFILYNFDAQLYKEYVGLSVNIASTLPSY